MKPSVFIGQPRSYRTFESDQDLKSFRVTVETSDLYVKALFSLEAETERLIRECRALVERAIELRPEFLTSMEPLGTSPGDSILAARMIEAGRKAGVGPMASVAGAVANYVGRGLMELSEEVIIENGGDLFVSVNRSIVVGVYAGKSPFSQKIGLAIEPTPIPIGISTSSGSVGPSKSLGKADSATVLSYDPILSDAVATALGNRIRGHEELGLACQWAMSVEGVSGCLAIIDDKMAALGNIELTPIH